MLTGFTNNLAYQKIMYLPTNMCMSVKNKMFLKSEDWGGNFGVKPLFVMPASQIEHGLSFCCSTLLIHLHVKVPGRQCMMANMV